MPMPILKVLRRLVAFQAGLFISASVTQLTCIVLAAQLNYFSGRSPASLVLELPWFLLLGNLVGGALIGAFGLFRARLPRDANTYLLLGLLLGLAPGGFAVEMLTKAPVSLAIAAGIVVAACFVVLLSDSVRESLVVADGA